MSNVVSAITNKAGEEELRNQISMLEVITMTNILSTNASKAYNKVASIGNMLGGLFGKKMCSDLEIEVGVKGRLHNDELSDTDYV